MNRVYFLSYVIVRYANIYGVCCFEAETKDEAIGKAYAHYKKLFPDSIVDINKNVAYVNCSIDDVRKE